MFQGIAVDKYTSVGVEERKHEAATINVRRGVQDEGRQEATPSPSSSINIPILCDVDEKKKFQLDALCQRPDMDNTMFLITKRSVNYPDIFSLRYGVLDTGFGLLLQNIGYTTVNPKGKCQHNVPGSDDVSMERYALGNFPKKFGIKWRYCDHLLWPYMLDNKYWVLFHVDLESWKVIVYDNNQLFYEEADIYPHVVPCINIIPEIIEKYVACDRVDLGKNKLQPLQYFRKRQCDIPQLKRFW
ncbi:Ulp1 protease family [Abeliophyllum distichum]|uniref:Ulp1 protease family n=1 Tax=Abeliophyllum distichum TaxID=126358 RepID=A0ABD1V5N3_9LAMI